MHQNQPQSFTDVALSAFPRALDEVARVADEEASRWVGQSYTGAFTLVQIQGDPVFIPYRIHFAALNDHSSIDAVSVGAACLLTRSTDGYLRERALRRILDVQQLWVVPYVLLLLGEYVVEINNDIWTNLPRLDRTTYVQFIRENRVVMRLLHARATSYWACYHRTAYQEKRDYPALAALRELEAWAA